MKKAERDWKAYIVDNGSYKLVALFVTLILWVTILGRRDFILSKEMDLEFLLPQRLVATDSVQRKVVVKVSGPRMALKRFGQNPGTITIDLGRGRIGRNKVPITPSNIEVPFGVKVLSVVPDSFIVTLVPTAQDTPGQ